ncbi:METTL5 family protein [Natrialbaceae archaeon AArc-T1-2]|uniref:METTL5 family protein n=1 Tax=Natrialbaceae archaeon AArc-T1-2 TaxID=3053904 RepID=UPI00255AC9F3|nr:METTL5 family protein [Natrialbaceae archaeon AArc-T1-2]WIV67177.1 METTL5 family protein [Natrialbaceae archaeon AArc-T1-2]
MVSRRELARRLESVTDFEAPSADLEQYLTPPEIAAHLLQFASLQDDLTGRSVVDLGAGTGMLAIGATAFSPTRVVGLELDPDAIVLARENERRVDLESAVAVDWVRADATRPPLAISEATVVSNPPFGAQNRHADRPFLESARELASVSYTIHNEGSQAFVESFAADNGGTVTHAFQATFELARRFPFHEHASRELEAEVFRIEWR